MTKPIVAFGIFLMLVTLTISVSWQNSDQDVAAVEVDEGGCKYIIIPTDAGKISDQTRENDVMKITVKPCDGYVFEKWTVQEQNGSETTLSESETVEVSLNHATYRAYFKPVTTEGGIRETDVQIPKIYSWACPVFEEGTLVGYEMKTYVMYIAESDYNEARSSSVQRSATVTQTMPTELILPEDSYIRKIASYLTGICDGMNDIQRAYVINCFVQDAVTYRYDICQYGTNEYWSLPVETLYTQYGDCEDTAILLCSIASAMGVNSALVAMQSSSSGHMGAAISIPYNSVDGATFLGTDGREYAYCETAVDPDRIKGEEWIIGKLPSKYSLDSAVIVLIEPVGVIL